MKKGDYIVNKQGNKVYQMVGRWGREIVLAIANEDSEEVLVYGAKELEEMIAEGWFRKLHRTEVREESR
jgi:hypothetical protein